MKYGERKKKINKKIRGREVRNLESEMESCVSPHCIYMLISAERCKTPPQHYPGMSTLKVPSHWSMSANSLSHNYGVDANRAYICR